MTQRAFNIHLGMMCLGVAVFLMFCELSIGLALGDIVLAFLILMAGITIAIRNKPLLVE